MLWQVLDTDINAMTEELIKVWCNPDQKAEGDIDSLEVELKNMKVDTEESKSLINKYFSSSMILFLSEN